MELGKYQNVLRAIKRKSGGLRTVVYDPSIDDTSVDFPDIEQPKMEFAGGGVVQREGFANSKSPYGTRFTEDLKKKAVELAKQGKSPEFIMAQPEFEGINNARNKIIAVINQSPKVPKKYKFIADARGQGFTFGQFDKIKKDVVSDFNKQEIKNISEIARDRFPQMRQEAATREVRRILQEQGVRNIPKPIEAKQGPKTQQQIESGARKEKIKILSDPSLERSLAGTDKIEFHHADSKNLNAKILTTANRTGYIDKKTNKDLRTGDALIDKFYEDRARLLKNKPKGGQALKDWQKKWEDINVKGMNTVANPKYKGLLNFKVIDPVTFEARDTGLDESKMLMRTPDPDVPGLYGQDDVLATKPFKEMTIEEKRKVRGLAEKQFKKLKNIKSQEAVNAISSIACPAQYSDGGRVNFQKGSNCYVKGLEIFEKAKAGDTSAISKIRKFTKSPLGKILGGVAAEAIIETAFLLPDIAEGKDWDEVLHNSTLGLLGFGKSADEKAVQYSSDPEKAQKFLDARNVYDQMKANENFVQMIEGGQEGEDFFTVESLRPKIKEQAQTVLESLQDPDTLGGQRALEEGEAKYEQHKADKRQRRLDELDWEPIFNEVMMFADGGRVGMQEGGDPKDKMKTPFDKPTLPLDPNQIPQVQSPSRRGFIKGLGFIGAGVAALASGLIRLGRKEPAKKLLQKAVTQGGRRIDGVPEIINDLINTIKLKGEVVDMPKPGSGPVIYKYNKYEYAEDVNGFTINKINDRGDYGYNEEVFQFEKDPETGAVFFDDVTVKPDGDGKLKDVEYGVDYDSYNEIAEDLTRFNHTHPNDTRFKDKARKFIDDERLRNEGMEPKPGTEIYE